MLGAFFISGTRIPAIERAVTSLLILKWRLFLFPETTAIIRNADDVLIFTKSEMAANRVMKSICSWLERKLFLKVNATKTKVVRPTRSKYLGFTFLKNGSEWKVRPTNEKKLKKKLSEYLKRGKAVARPLAVTIKRVNEIVRGWINYFRIQDWMYG